MERGADGLERAIALMEEEGDRKNVALFLGHLGRLREGVEGLALQDRAEAMLREGAGEPALAVVLALRGQVLARAGGGLKHQQRARGAWRRLGQVALQRLCGVRAARRQWIGSVQAARRQR